MKVITTCHKAGFDLYGHRWIDGAKNWPEANLTAYLEGMPEFCADRDDRPQRGVVCVDVAAIPRLAAFKAAHANYRAPSWRYDIVRFSNKVFAAHDAFYNHNGIGVWLDADAVTFNKIPEDYIEQQLNGAFFAHFKRADWYTETGMWIMDCRHPETKAFLDTWLQWFESGEYKRLHEWHDCTTLDATLKLFLADGRITTRSLSGEFERFMHPMAKADIAKYIDHCKGNRKADGFSPENEHRCAP